MTTETARVVRYFEKNFTETEEEKRLKEQNLIKVIRMQYDKSKPTSPRAYYHPEDAKFVDAKASFSFGVRRLKKETEV